MSTRVNPIECDCGGACERDHDIDRGRVHERETHRTNTLHGMECESGGFEDELQMSMKSIPANLNRNVFVNRCRL